MPHPAVQRLRECRLARDEAVEQILALDEKKAFSEEDRRFLLAEADEAEARAKLLRFLATTGVN